MVLTARPAQTSPRHDRGDHSGEAGRASHRRSVRRPRADRVGEWLALLVLAILLLALPVLLALLTAPLLPSRLPTLSGVQQALTEPDTGQVLAGALLVLGWCGWASFAVSVGAESVAYARGRAAPRVPALGSVQRFAAQLVAAAR